MEKNKDNNINVVLGNRLKQLRESRGLTISALARGLTCENKIYKYTSIRRYEIGEAIFTVEFLLELCTFFGVSINYFLINQDKIVLNSSDNDCNDIILTLNRKNRNKLLKLFAGIQEISNEKIFDIILNLIEEIINSKAN